MTRTDTRDADVLSGDVSTEPAPPDLSLFSHITELDDYGNRVSLNKAEGTPEAVRAAMPADAGVVVVVEEVPEPPGPAISSKKSKKAKKKTIYDNIGMSVPSPNQVIEWIE